MMRKIYMIISIVTFCGTALQAQNETMVNVGDDLIQAIQDASDGDILVLAQGTHVATYTSMDIHKTLTIKGEPGEEMPMLYIQQFDVYADGESFTLENLHILGARIDSASGTQLHLDTLEADYAMNLVSSSLEPTDAAYNTLGDLTFQSCIVSHLERAAIRGDRDSYAINDILIDDCIMHDFRGGSSYGPFRLKSNLTFNSFMATNSTFYDFPLVFLDCQDMASNPTLYHVENCTFYNWGGRDSEGKYLFDINTNDQATLVIKSCIFGESPMEVDWFVGGFRFLEAATTQISFTAMTPEFQPTSLGYAEVMWDLDEYNVTDMDPEWADPANGDFSLPEGSDFLQMSPEGTVIGDPRWDPNYGVGIGRDRVNGTLSVYPNPASERVLITLDDAAEVVITSITGQNVIRNYLPAGTQQLDISGLSSGIYFLSTGNLTDIVKLVIQ